MNLAVIIVSLFLSGGYGLPQRDLGGFRQSEFEENAVVFLPEVQTRPTIAPELRDIVELINPYQEGPFYDTPDDDDDDDDDIITPENDPSVRNDIPKTNDIPRKDFIPTEIDEPPKNTISTAMEDIISWNDLNDFINKTINLGGDYISKGIDRAGEGLDDVSDKVNDWRVMFGNVSDLFEDLGLNVTDLAQKINCSMSDEQLKAVLDEVRNSASEVGDTVGDKIGVGLDFIGNFIGQDDLRIMLSILAKMPWKTEFKWLKIL